jgi:hypothetical protein
MRIFGLEAAILDFPHPVSSESICPNPIQMSDLENVGLVRNFVSISSGSWDIRISGF